MKELICNHLLHMKEPIISDTMYDLYVAVHNLVTRGMAGRVMRLILNTIFGGMMTVLAY